MGKDEKRKMKSKEPARGRRHTAGLAERLLKIGKDCAAHLEVPFRSVDHGELLYNEKGVPK